MSVEAAEFEKRSQELADKLRAFLIAANTGAVGVTFAVAGSLASHKVNPAWTVWPIALFVAGLGVAAISIFLAQHRTLKRRDSARNGTPLPNFTGIFWRSYTWNAVSLGLFLAGVAAGLLQIRAISIAQ